MTQITTRDIPHKSETENRKEIIVTGRETQDVPEKTPIPAGAAFIGLSATRSTEAQLRWIGLQLVAALNLPALFWVAYKLFVPVEPPNFFVFAAGCALGVALNYKWYTILRRDSKLFGLWNRKLKELEEVNNIEGGVKIFTSDEYERLPSSRDSVQHSLEKLQLCYYLFGQYFL